MKTLILASAIVLASNIALADSSWEDVWQNPDLDAKYGLAYNMADPAPSGYPITVSLDEFGRDNPDLYSGFAGPGDEIRQSVSMGYRLNGSSLEAFTAGNPDIDTGPQWN